MREIGSIEDLGRSCAFLCLLLRQPRQLDSTGEAGRARSDDEHIEGNGLLPRRRYWERAQDPVGGPGEPIGDTAGAGRRAAERRPSARGLPRLLPSAPRPRRRERLPGDAAVVADLAVEVDVGRFYDGDIGEFGHIRAYAVE